MTRNPTALKLAALLAGSVSCLAGCMSFNPASLRAMEAALLESNPDLVIAESMKFGFGALTLDFVDFAFVHERGIDVSKISRADIGIYELNGTLAVDAFTLPQDFSADRSCPRREVIVRIREENEHTQIAVCIRDEKITGLAVFVLEPRGIVVINARGDFEALVGSLVRDSVKRKPRESAAQASTGHAQAPAVSAATNPRVDGALPPS